MSSIEKGEEMESVEERQKRQRNYQSELQRRDNDSTASSAKRLKKVAEEEDMIENTLNAEEEILGDISEQDVVDVYEIGDVARSGENAEEVKLKRTQALTFMGPKDREICETDIPERIQLFEEITGPPPTDDESIEEETMWIYNQLAAGVDAPFRCMDRVLEEINIEEIGNVLALMHVQKYEIPFIAMYRKELCSSLLKDPDDNPYVDQKTPRMRWHKMLWSIHALDRKWLLLRKRKSALEVSYNKRFEEQAQRFDDEIELALNQRLFQSVIEALRFATSEIEVDDVDAKFNLHYLPDETKIIEDQPKSLDGEQLKRLKSKSMYSTCYNAGLWEVTNKFSINSKNFGLLAFGEVRRDDIEDPEETPEDVAANFTCQMFKTPQDVLEGARHMVAIEISCEPIVRKYVRTVFMENAVVSTVPTLEGNLTIDDHHQLSGVKWLRNKPISKFEDEQWLLIQQAEDEKLLQVTIKLTEANQNTLLADAIGFYLSESVSKSAQLWNEQRTMTVEDSFFTYILPSMENEARLFLTARSKNLLLMEYGKQLWNKVSVAPYRISDANDDFYENSEEDSVNVVAEDEPRTRVLACCWGHGKPATTFVMLDSKGELLDVVSAGSISLRPQSVAEQQLKKNDQQSVMNLLINHRPQVVCLGAANLSCRELKDEIYEVFFKITEDRPELFACNIKMVDESLSRLYENSKASSDQLPEQPGIVKRAVGLGRYFQNPLAMIATLCGPSKDILSWKLSPLDHFLSPNEKYEMVEMVMVDATNQVGMDVNLATSHEWFSAPLQFVSGLGPRKASALHNALGVESILTREEIKVDMVIRGRVLANAVGFLRVRRSGAAATSSHLLDFLDDTRIHPESYELARDLADDVYAEFDEEFPSGRDDDDAQSSEQFAIEYVRERLNALDTEEYAKIHFEHFGINKRQTLYDIKMELLIGFQDWRIPFLDMSPEKEFFLLYGETEDSISDGRTVQVTVRDIEESHILCVFDCGLEAMVLATDFSFEGYDLDELQLREGDTLTAKIKYIDKFRYLVYLTCKESDPSSRVRHFSNRDPYYHEEKILHSQLEKAREDKELAKKHFKPRAILHPHFRNWTADEAMEYLSDKDVGISIIHPSSNGIASLTITLKVYDGVYIHKYIYERGEDQKDVTDLLCHGNALIIDQETFVDLDEVMDRYVDPLVSHLKSMPRYNKFKRGTKAEVDDLLRTEEADKIPGLAYCCGASHERPGTFVLSYIENSIPHHVYIELYPKGFRFLNEDFDDIDQLVEYLQRNIDTLPSDARISTGHVADRVPIKSQSSFSGEASVQGGSEDVTDDWTGHSNSGDECYFTPHLGAGSNIDYRINDGGWDVHPSGTPSTESGYSPGLEIKNLDGASSAGPLEWSDSDQDDALIRLP